MTVQPIIAESDIKPLPGAGEQLDMICNWLRRAEVGQYEIKFTEPSRGIFDWNGIVQIQVKYMTLEDVYIYIRDLEFKEEYSYRGPHPLVWFKKTMDECNISTFDLVV